MGVFSLPSPCRRGDWGEVVTHYEYSGTNYNMTSELHQRHIPFEGCHNFRDVGGYKAINGSMVGWRRLYRSSEIHYMTDADVTHARDSLGVTTAIDLRQPSVAARDGERYLTRPPVRYHNIALIDDGDAASDLEPADPIPMTVDYLQRLEQPQYGGGIINAIKTIAEPDALPAVFHCSAGKDRTGLLAAVLLGVLGVADEDIVRDYAITARYMHRLVDHWWLTDRKSSAKYFNRLPPYMYDARPETMEYVLTTLYREYGSMQGYFEAQGGDAALIRRLEDILLGCVDIWCIMDTCQRLNYAMNNGQKSLNFCAHAQTSTLERRTIAGATSRPSCGWHEVVLLGDCCLSTTVTGTAYISASHAGVKRVYGNECISILCKTPIWSMSSLIAL